MQLSAERSQPHALHWWIWAEKPTVLSRKKVKDSSGPSVITCCRSCSPWKEYVGYHLSDPSSPFLPLRVLLGFTLHDYWFQGVGEHGEDGKSWSMGKVGSRDWDRGALSSLGSLQNANWDGANPWLLPVIKKAARRHEFYMNTCRP